MFKKILLVVFTTFALTFNVNAGSDGELLLKKNEPSEVKDCFEKINRATFAFNMALDKVLFKPISKGYRYLPSPIRSGTSNALNNLSNLVTVPNNILQGDFKAAANNTARFFINSTIGILGLFDPAESLGLSRLEKEDYGQSFGKMGIGEGCYLVLPVLGPSTARDAIGSLVTMSGGDAWYNVTVKNNTTYVKESDYYYSKAMQGVDFRAKNLEAFDSLEKNSVDFYATVRSLYIQDRNRKIGNVDKTTETRSDDDWEELEK